MHCRGSWASSQILTAMGKRRSKKRKAGVKKTGLTLKLWFREEHCLMVPRTYQQMFWIPSASLCRTAVRRKQQQVHHSRWPSRVTDTGPLGSGRHTTCPEKEGQASSWLHGRNSLNLSTSRSGQAFGRYSFRPLFSNWPKVMSSQKLVEEWRTSRYSLEKHSFVWWKTPKKS